MTLDEIFEYLELISDDIEYETKLGCYTTYQLLRTNR
jgi:hypothetical protein